MFVSRRMLMAMNFAFVGLNAAIMLAYFSMTDSGLSTYSWVGHDFPERFPLSEEPETVLMTVEESSLYPIGEQGNAAWHKLTTTSRGYCRLGPHHRMFAVTMFHELHCLRILNSAFGAGTHIGHVVHCLSYLRHGVLCSADLTLEPGDFARRNFTRDRVGATHECRDWKKLYEALEDNWERWYDKQRVLFPGDD